MEFFTSSTKPKSTMSPYRSSLFFSYPKNLYNQEEKTISKVGDFLVCQLAIYN